MSRGQNTVLGFFRMTMVAIVALVAVWGALELSNFFGAITRNMFSAAVTGNLEVNYIESYLLNHDTLHCVVEASVWMVVLTAVIHFTENKRLVETDGNMLQFALLLLMIFVCSELFSYVAYLIQFIVDAVTAGVTSRSQSVTLINLVSIERWKEVDWAARFFQAFATTKALLLIKYAYLKNRTKREKKAERARRAAEREEKRQEQIAREEEEERRQRIARDNERHLRNYEIRKARKQKLMIEGR